MNRTAFLLIVFIITLISTSCHKTPDNTVTPDYDFSELSKDYLIFEQGSRWTYKDDSTQQTSVVEIYSTSQEMRTSGGGTSPQYTYMAKWMWYNQNNVNLQKGEAFASNFEVPPDVPNSAERVYFTDGHYKIAFAPFYPFNSPIILGGEEGVFINKELIPTFTLNGKTYTDVYHSVSQDILQAAPDTVFYHFYFAKNFGLVKYTIDSKQDTISVSLTESSLIQ